MKFFQKILIIFLIFSMTFGTASLSFAGESNQLVQPKLSISTARNGIGEYISAVVKEPGIGSIGGEWAVLGLARSGCQVPQNYYDNYYNKVVRELTEKKGELSKNKYTEYSRLILALTAIGKDVTNVGGYNLLEKLADFQSVTKQGINGPIFALIALDSHHYDIPKVEGIAVQTTRQMLIDYIISKEITSKDGVVGGFSLTGNVPDPDITGMALQALSNYQDQTKVKVVTERALNAISEYQLENGGYGSWGTENSESTAQMIVALSALKIDASKDKRFIKTDGKGHKNWLVSNLMTYCIPVSEQGLKGYGFEHVLNNGINQMATEQGFYALVSYERFLNGKTSLYHMTDVSMNKDVNTDSTSGLSEIKVTLNGTALHFEQPPIMKNGRVLVPLRAIFEAIGAKVEWNPTSQKVTGTLGNTEVIMVIGSKVAYVNQVERILDVPGQVIYNRTFVPARFIAESLNADVQWDQNTNTVIIKKDE